MHKRGAFTLVELLVVVSIIALLLTLLTPSLQRAREMAKSISCSSNLHQQGNGMHLYVTTYGAYPGHAGNTTGGVAAIWPTRIRKFSNSRDHFYCPTQPIGWRWQKKTTGTGKFAQQADVDNWSYELGELLLTVHTVPFTYGYNDWGATGAGPTDSQMDVGGQKGLGGDIRWGGLAVPELPVGRVQVPSDMIAISDSAEPDASWDFNIDPTNPREYPGKFHFGGSNVLFADAHVKWLHLEDMVVRAWDDKGKENARRWNNHNWWNAWEKAP
ncbi:MAG: hypothetical protein BWX88_02442 [Planctomycetes bacterium ADurb.Bin126]|nr:MAG: hypothetical protein BWX88_02442 [Planctomycetes bacterium ADurb.Bin126]HQL72439.1 DUF1559 domain-containing protein [Phycisphaerae bacterium]